MIEHVNRVPASGEENRKEITLEGTSGLTTLSDVITFLQAAFNGTVEYDDNPTEVGTTLNKALLDEFLAGSGTTAGTGSALTLAQDGFSLADGAVVRFKLHTDISAGATLNVESTGAKDLVDKYQQSVRAGFKSGSYITAIYSSTLDDYVISQGAFQADYGTRTGGGSSSVSIVFSFTPKILIVVGGGSVTYPGLGVFIYNNYGVAICYYSSTVNLNGLTIDSWTTTVTWSGGPSAQARLDYSGDTYAYLALTWAE